MNKNLTQNQDGNWIPAIPEPYYGMRKWCECGERFWTLEGYRAHYSYVHILEPAPKKEKKSKK